MRRLILVAVCVLPIFDAGAQEVNQLAGPVIIWEKNSYDFGDVTEGEKVSYTFKFTNAGNAALVITNVEVTCGCTTPKGWTRDPIAPGSTGDLTVAFNSTGKLGKQNKVITVTSNSVGTTNQVTIVVNVLAKKHAN